MGNNYIRRFTFDKLPIHGVFVELTDVWQTIAAQKEYPDGIRRILGELLVANILLTANIKLNGKIIVQIQDNPKLDLAVSECSNDLKVRATAKYSTSIHQDNQISYKDCVSKGNLIVTIDSDTDGKLYQSVVMLNNHALDEVLTEYMLQSEQLRTLFFIAYSENRVVGFMLQQLPDNTGNCSDDIERVFMLADTLQYNELLNKRIDTILSHLFSEDDVMLFEPKLVQFKCACGRERVTNMLRGLGLEEAASIIASEGVISVTCDFCNTIYSFDEHDVENMFSNLCIDIECISQELH